MITSAKKLKYSLPDDTEVVANIEIVKDGQIWTVPMAEGNSDYIEILRLVDTGELTIEPADE